MGEEKKLIDYCHVLSLVRSVILVYVIGLILMIFKVHIPAGRGGGDLGASLGGHFRWAVVLINFLKKGSAGIQKY